MTYKASEDVAREAMRPILIVTWVVLLCRYIVSDCDAVALIHDYVHFAPSLEAAVSNVMLAGTNLSPFSISFSSQCQFAGFQVNFVSESFRLHHKENLPHDLWWGIIVVTLITPYGRNNLMETLYDHCNHMERIHNSWGRFSFWCCLKTPETICFF